MPLKSLTKCICVSKTWATIIRGKQFKDLYLLLSMTRPRVLVAFVPAIQPSPEKCEVLSHSVHQDEKPLLSSGPQQVSYILSKPTYGTSEPIRGLVCFKTGDEDVICNPGTNKFVTLPKIQGRTEISRRTLFMGYDEVTNVFKVLCMEKLEFFGSREPHVLTMGSSGVECWRQITCTYGHLPIGKGLCKGGHVYYVARSELTYEVVVMKFDVGSEEFSGFKLPKCVHGWYLVNYKGETAAVSGSKDWIDDEIEIWVLDEEAEKFSRIHIVISGWRETIVIMKFAFKGIIGTGELVFAPEMVVGRPICVMYYDTVTKILRRFEIEGMTGCQYGFVQTFLNHVDSPLLL